MDENNNYITLNNDFIEQLIINLYNCYYSTIEIKNNYLFFSNKKKIKIFNPFDEQKIDKNKIQNSLIYILPHYINSYLNKLELIENKSIKIQNSINLLKFISQQELDFKDKAPNNLIIIYFANLINIEYCKNIQTYIKKEEEFRKINGIKKIYYRGNKLNYDLSTSLYRDSKIPNFEHIINNRCIQSMPNDFNKCETFFDKLTILKHFNCPSRLLDITESPLIAAFFALDIYNTNKTSKYGAINLCFPNDDKKIKNAKNSDSVSLISALCTTKKDIYSYSKVVERLIELLKELNFQYLNNEEDFTILFSDYSLFKEIIQIKELLKITISILNDTNLIKIRNSLSLYLTKILFFEKNAKDKKEFSNLFKNFREETIKLINNLKNNELLAKYFFEGELQHQASLFDTSFNLYLPKYDDINSYYIVHPSKNNERIRNQQGLFILIGACYDRQNYYLRSNQSYLKLFQNENKRTVFIINNKKNKFYKELNNVYGINNGFVYPEMEKKINQIKNNVMYEYGIE